MISKKCKYALRAILFLAVESDEGQKKGLKDIAEELKIPTPFLAKILQELVPKKIISSVKGPKGGFFLTKENRDTPLIKIVEAIDGLTFFDNCGLGLASCSDENPCPIHKEFKIAKKQIEEIFTDKTVQQLSEETISNDLVLVI